MSTGLSLLPAELFDSIITHIPTEAFQQTLLSLTRAIPQSPVRQDALFFHVRISRAEQAVQLYRRLRGTGQEYAPHVRTFELVTWLVDADVMVNLVHLLSDVENMRLHIGTTFAPEHLAEMFEKPILGLRYLSIRFRPYVQKATYYHFLKGAYFDSTLVALSKWRSRGLSSLSIVQDPYPLTSSSETKFAQPIVFFLLEPISILATSPFLRHLTNLRLRIPSRQLTHHLVARAGSLPSLEFLDLSTCNIHQNDVDGLLMRFARLRHLIVDDCSIISGAELREDEWARLGKNIALAGVKRAKTREKSLKAWLEQEALQNTEAKLVASSQPLISQAETSSKGRRGRRGLATATISLRKSPPRDSAPLPSIADAHPNVRNSVPKVRVVPPAPSLSTFSTTTVHQEKRTTILSEFTQGWMDGLRQLNATRARLRQSKGNGFRIMKLATHFSGVHEGFDGLVDVELNSDGAFDPVDMDCPILCLAGQGREAEHTEGCGHSRGFTSLGSDLQE